MVRPVDNWRPTWVWVWETRRLWFNGFTVLALVQMLLVVGFVASMDTPASRARTRRVLTTQMRPTGALPGANRCPPAQQADLMGDVVTSNVIQSYVRARMRKDVRGAGEALAQLRKEGASAVPMLRTATTNAGDARLRRYLQEAIAELE